MNLFAIFILVASALVAGAPFAVSLYSGQRGHKKDRRNARRRRAQERKDWSHGR